MKKDDISRLLQHYLSAKEEGKEPYFDADQIDEMLDSFEDSNDYTYFDEVLALGLKLHPGNSALQIKKGRQFAYNEDIAGRPPAVIRLVDLPVPADQHLSHRNLQNDLISLRGVTGDLIEVQIAIDIRRQGIQLAGVVTVLVRRRDATEDRRYRCQLR